MSDTPDLPADLLFSIQVKVAFTGGDDAKSSEAKEELGEQPTFAHCEIFIGKAHYPRFNLRTSPNLTRAHAYRHTLADRFAIHLQHAVTEMARECDVELRSNADQPISKKRAERLLSYIREPRKWIEESQQKRAKIDKVDPDIKDEDNLPHNLWEAYKTVLPVWRETCKLYKKATKRGGKALENWREDSLKFFADLPIRDPYPDLLDWVVGGTKGPGGVAEFVDHRGFGLPAAIARRHAARLCLMADRDYTDNTLKKMLKPSARKKKN
jgi:hypothetical protein